MTLHAVIQNRDFSTKPIHPANLRIDKLTWSAFGGCDEAFLSAGAPINRLLEFTGMLRCPIIISDEFSIPSWWGYVNKISIYFEKSQFSISLEDLYNRVNVKYSFISPDGKLADLQETGFAEDTLSKTEFGIREIVLKQNNIDDEFAGNLRDTFLEISAFPHSKLAPSTFGDPIIKLYCKGWFHTLDWVNYQNLDGFYANHGPGPGFAPSGDGTVSFVAMGFRPSKNVDVKYAYLQLRKVGSPVSNITAHIYSSAVGLPLASLTTSTAISGSTLSVTNYRWTKFTFPTALTLTAGTLYFLLFNPNTSSATNFYQLRTDENSNYIQSDLFGVMYYAANWHYITSITIPGSCPDLMFRVVCEQDTGAQLFDIATAGNQFFNHIGSITTGVKTSPFRNNGYSVLKEVLSLMKLGTSNQRLITSCVNPQRRLYWYELPDAAEPTIYMDRFGRFFTKEQKFLQPYFPPIGQFAILSGIDRLVMPFDRYRIPTYFVDQATYTP